MDGSDPTYMRARIEFSNPTNGSWWIVQIRPPKQGGPSAYERLSFMDLLREQVGSEPSTNSRWWDSQILEGLSLCRPDLNHPPTAVGGISDFSQLAVSEQEQCLVVSALPAAPASFSWSA